MKRYVFALMTGGICSTLLAAPLPQPTYFSNYQPTPANYASPFESLYGSVVVPDLSGGFILGLAEYYLQPQLSNGDLDYLTESGRASGGQHVFNTSAIQPDYDWGWSINAGYAFPGTANDIQARYFHLHTYDYRDTNVDNVITVFSVIPGIQIFGRVKPVTRIYIDQLDLVGGQSILVGESLLFHLTGGVRGLDLHRKLHLIALGLDTAPPETIQNVYDISEYSSFLGIGPILGVDGTYNIYRGFGIAGYGDGGVLIGQGDSTANVSITTDDDVPANIVFNLSGSYHRMAVPFVDGRIALSYIYSPSPDAHFRAELGFQSTEYFNPVNRVLFNSPIVNRPFHKSANVSLNGPYISLTFAA